MVLTQGGYFFIVNTIKNVKIKITIMYSTIPPPFTRELKQPPPFLYAIHYIKYAFFVKQKQLKVILTANRDYDIITM